MQYTLRLKKPKDSTNFKNDITVEYDKEKFTLFTPVISEGKFYTFYTYEFFCDNYEGEEIVFKTLNGLESKIRVTELYKPMSIDIDNQYLTINFGESVDFVVTFKYPEEITEELIAKKSINSINSEKRQPGFEIMTKDQENYLSFDEVETTFEDNILTCKYKITSLHDSTESIRVRVYDKFNTNNTKLLYVNIVAAS